MKMKKQLLALLLAAVMVLSLTGCKETLKKVAQKITGHEYRPNLNNLLPTIHQEMFHCQE